MSGARRLAWAGILIGFSLGGFFDGILLHQVLQWHHLLSGVEAVRDLRTQVMADGLFHALMYLLGAIGLWMLYRSRKALTGNLLADVLIGFGAWHVVDAVASHWLTGIHRIRMDAAEPLLWDIGWLAVFGLPPLVAGLLMNRRTTASRGVAASIAALTVAAGAWASVPQGFETVTVVLRPDVRPGQFLAAMKDDPARVLWTDLAGGVWVLTATKDSPWRHYRHGALYVAGSALPAGCAAWTRVAGA